jgi:hypothetical protein
MGSFYDNALVTAPLDRTVAVLWAAGATGLATAVNDDLSVVYPHEGMDAATLSRELGTSVLTADMHDSDVLRMQVWTSGSLVHDYCNAPTYFAEEYREIDGVSHGLVDYGHENQRWIPSGPMGVSVDPFEPFVSGQADRAALLAVLANRPQDPETPTHNDGYLFANNLHWDAMNAMGLPAQLLTTGYLYLTRADNPHFDYASLVPFGAAERPDPAAPKPVSRFTREQLKAIREQSRMLATLHGGPRHGEQEWVPFSAMFNGIDSGDGGSYQFNADPEPPGGEFRYVADQPPSDVPWPPDGLVRGL